MNSDQKTSERGNVASIVDRLSKNFGTGAGAMTKSSSENVPLRKGVINNSAATVVTSAAGIDSMLGGGGFSSTTDTAIVRFSYAAQQPDELDLKEGDELLVLEVVEDGWAKGEILNSSGHPARKGRVGLYPTNFVSTVSNTPTSQTPPSITSGTASTLPRAIETHQDHLGPPDGGIPLISRSAPKSSNLLTMSNGATGVENKRPEHNRQEHSPGGVVNTGNLLPSALKAASGAGAASIGTGTGGRRAMSTLISSGNNTLNLGAKSTQNHQEQGQHQNQTLSSQASKYKEFAKVLYKYDAAAPDELSLPEGAMVAVVSRDCEDEGWFVAESMPDGHRGLFPDNFVKFLPAELAPPFQTSPTSHLPPSLPAKPQKFAGAQLHPQHLHGQGPPVASTRDSISALTVQNSSFPTSQSVIDPVIHPVAPNKHIMTTSVTTTAAADTTSSDVENNNNSNIGNTHGLNPAANSIANRRSVVGSIQSKIFPDGKLPDGKLPMQQRPISQKGGGHGKSDTESTNVEPKLEFEVDNADEKRQKLLTSSIVKSRTGIAPSNKRPPSKVNSAAILAADTSGNANNNNTSGRVSRPLSPSPSTSPSTPNKERAYPLLATAMDTNNKAPSVNIPVAGAAGNKATVFPSQGPSSPSSGVPMQSLHCKVDEDVATIQHKYHPASGTSTTTASKSSPLFQQPPVVPPPPATSPFHQQKAPSPSGSSVLSHPSTVAGSTAGMATAASHSSQWVSRVEHERFMEECRQKFAELSAELAELRKRVEIAQTK